MDNHKNNNQNDFQNIRTKKLIDIYSSKKKSSSYYNQKTIKKHFPRFEDNIIFPFCDFLENDQINIITKRNPFIRNKSKRNFNLSKITKKIKFDENSPLKLFSFPDQNNYLENFLAFRNRFKNELFGISVQECFIIAENKKNNKFIKNQNKKIIKDFINADETYKHKIFFNFKNESHPFNFWIHLIETMNSEPNLINSFPKLNSKFPNQMKIHHPYGIHPTKLIVYGEQNHIKIEAFENINSIQQKLFIDEEIKWRLSKLSLQNPFLKSQNNLSKISSKEVNQIIPNDKFDEKIKNNLKHNIDHQSIEFMDSNKSVKSQEQLDKIFGNKLNDEKLFSFKESKISSSKFIDKNRLKTMTSPRKFSNNFSLETFKELTMKNISDVYQRQLNRAENQALYNPKKHQRIRKSSFSKKYTIN